jgi:DNA-binding NtrC family response regulator
VSLTKPYHVLIVDDDIDILAALKLLLNCENYEVTITSCPEQAIILFKKNNFDAVLLDLNFQQDTTSGEEGLELLGALNAIEENIPFIVMTGWANINIAVSAMQKGAADFVEKPWDNDRLLSILSIQIKLSEQLHKTKKLDFENKLLKAEQSIPLMSTQSPTMKKVLMQVKHIAQSDVSILITGENGTGKSLLAEQIHQASNRSDYSMINVNMSAIPESLFESEMFGHVKGAFTDAKEQRIGRFELANKGSLFLDEIGNIPLSQQSKLLRVLESLNFEKVGASKTQYSDARIIAATNADIEKNISDGQFRQDLFYRLNGIEIKLPSLRDRTEDIMPLANNFLEIYAVKYKKTGLTFTNSALNALTTYPWPGNIRELNHMVERAVILCSTKQVTADLLAISCHAVNEQDTLNGSLQLGDNDQTIEQLEQVIIQQRIQYHQGNMQNAAKSLGLSRSAFYRRIDKYHL